MKRFVILFLLLNFHLIAYNQVIKGSVLDENTKTPVFFATVYFNGTFNGTIADENGNFEFDISKNKSMPITISALGYYSTTVKINSAADKLIIYLTPKLFELQEVKVSDKSLVRKRRANLALFKDEFLGTTANAQMCEIMNENDISFDYDSGNDTLIAFASKPILIKNNALGYNISYYLDKFEYYKKRGTVFFYGNIIFSEDTVDNQTQKEELLRKRKYAYLGSRMHFFRELWLENSKSSDFILKNFNGKELKFKNLIFKDDSNQKFLINSENFTIGYFTSQTYVFFLKSKVYFTEDGYFDPSGINWKGEMANQRIADWLPYEY